MNAYFSADAAVKREVGVLLDLVVLGADGVDDRDRAHAGEDERPQPAVEDVPEHLRAPADHQQPIVVDGVAGRNDDALELQRDGAVERQRGARAEEAVALGAGQRGIVGDPELEVVGKELIPAHDAELDLHTRSALVLSASR